MVRAFFVACCLGLSALPAFAQFPSVGGQGGMGGIPGLTPGPQGGPVIGPNGQIISGMERRSPWSGGFELGLSGSDGNTEVLKIRLGGDIKYETPENLLVASGWYGLTRQNGALAENKALFTLRDEVPLFDQIAWFGQFQFEFDEFREVDKRYALHNGISWLFIKNETTSFRARVGAGASREVGGPRSGWIPEGIAGFDFDQQITQRAKFTSALDYYPDIGNWSHYRVRGRAAIDFLIDPELCITLRLGVQNRYDSHPGTSKANDLDYFATLVWRF